MRIKKEKRKVIKLSKFKIFLKLLPVFLKKFLNSLLVRLQNRILLKLETSKKKKKIFFLLFSSIFSKWAKKLFFSFASFYSSSFFPFPIFYDCQSVKVLNKLIECLKVCQQLRNWQLTQLLPQFIYPSLLYISQEKKLWGKMKQRQHFMHYCEVFKWR